MSRTQPIAFITGTSTGFGNQIARDLAAAGYRTFASMRDTAKRNAEPKRALEALGITVLEVDLSSDASVEAAAAIVNAVGPVDVLVNNAGATFAGLSEAYTPALAAKQFDVNVFSTLRVNRAFLPAMRAAKRGLIVYISSVVGRIAFPFNGIYTASKWALEALAETASYELRPFGIDVAIVEPGAYGTNILSVMTLPDDEARVKSYGDVAKIADKIFGGLADIAGDPREVSNAVLAIVKQPAGERPLRTPVGAPKEIDALNAAAAPLQRALLESYGLGALLPREKANA